MTVIPDNYNTVSVCSELIVAHCGRQVSILQVPIAILVPGCFQLCRTMLTLHRTMRVLQRARKRNQRAHTAVS